MKSDKERIREVLGSAGCQPAFVGNLPTKLCPARLPNTAGKLPAIPNLTDAFSISQI